MDKLEIKQGSSIQHTQYFIPDSRSGRNQCFSGFVHRTGMFGNLRVFTSDYLFINKDHGF
jgi:hypothetical protein